MIEKAYLFRREDNQEIVEVPFETMMDQIGGWITLSDGVQARRCVRLELERDKEPDRRKTAGRHLNRPILSDAMGFGQGQFADFEEDRRKHGFRGVEFVRDRDVPEFFQVKCSSAEEHRRYVKHRGMVDKTSTGGKAFLSERDFQRATQLVKQPNDRRVGLKIR